MTYIPIMFTFFSLVETLMRILIITSSENL